MQYALLMDGQEARGETPTELSAELDGLIVIECADPAAALAFAATVPCAPRGSIAVHPIAESG
jgi:hypothetical protein